MSAQNELSRMFADIEFHSEQALENLHLTRQRGKLEKIRPSVLIFLTQIALTIALIAFAADFVDVFV